MNKTTRANIYKIQYGKQIEFLKDAAVLSVGVIVGFMAICTVAFWITVF